MLASTSATAQGASEYEVKAAFLYNFAKFVEWPGRADGDGGLPPLKLCILGENPFGPLLAESVKGRQVQGRELSVTSVPGLQSARETCDIVFVSRSEEADLGLLLPSLAQRPILTVSDIPGFADKGGIIGMKMEGQKVRFEVNVLAARQAGLKLSSQLLKVAVQIIGHLEEAP